MLFDCVWCPLTDPSLFTYRPAKVQVLFVKNVSEPIGGSLSWRYFFVSPATSSLPHSRKPANERSDRVLLKPNTRVADIIKTDMDLITIRRARGSEGHRKQEECRKILCGPLRPLCDLCV